MQHTTARVRTGNYRKMCAKSKASRLCSSRRGTGENLYMMGGRRPGITSVMRGWYRDEERKYKNKYGQKSGFSGGTGHFTQVVWKSSYRLGCAAGRTGRNYYWVRCAAGRKGRNYYWVGCVRSDPAGDSAFGYCAGTIQARCPPRRERNCTHFYTGGFVRAC